MLTDATKAVFARDMQAVDDLNAGWWTPEYIEGMRRSTTTRHADYEAAFDCMVVEITAMEANSRKYACDLLKRLGGKHCFSGSLEFRATCDALIRMGVTRPNGIFDHDRKWVAETHTPTKQKETAE